MPPCRQHECAGPGSPAADRGTDVCRRSGSGGRGHVARPREQTPSRRRSVGRQQTVSRQTVPGCSRPDSLDHDHVGNRAARHEVQIRRGRPRLVARPCRDVPVAGASVAVTFNATAVAPALTAPGIENWTTRPALTGPVTPPIPLRGSRSSRRDRKRCRPRQTPPGRSSRGRRLPHRQSRRNERVLSQDSPRAGRWDGGSGTSGRHKVLDANATRPELSSNCSAEPPLTPPARAASNHRLRRDF